MRENGELIPTIVHTKSGFITKTQKTQIEKRTFFTVFSGFVSKEQRRYREREH
jgi:hypothetical protein